MVPQINSVGLKQRSLQLTHTSRRGSCKILRLKSSHCMHNTDKIKVQHKTQPNCETCQAKEIPEHYFLDMFIKKRPVMLNLRKV